MLQSIALLSILWSSTVVLARVEPVLEPVIADTFANRATLEAAWNYGYPWGRDHNGSARMDPAQITLAHGVLTIRATGSTDRIAAANRRICRSVIGRVHCMPGKGY